MCGDQRLNSGDFLIHTHLIVFFQRFTLCARVFLCTLSLCALCVQVLLEARREHWIPWSFSYRQLRALDVGPEIQAQILWKSRE